ncbi:DgyrCDS12001 [Dimorphilus gyrociliatus]|uniref:DgyrCDS12001 n=1 Tax=Dimorphilus gyrociliatus TaxID=2664684 RepID=A0A7I8W557_9ANNE|nr:DgyrCDS12001 [Dimorphilus gyrociliatus]
MSEALDNLLEDEKDWKNLIEDNFAIITEILRPDDVANWLRQEKILRQANFEDVTNPHSNNKKRAQILLDIVLSRSSHGIKKFLTIISYEYPVLFTKITGLEPFDLPDDYTPKRLSTYATNVCKKSLKTAINKYQLAHVELDTALKLELNKLLQGGDSRLTELRFKIDELQEQSDFYKEKYSKAICQSTELKAENEKLKRYLQQYEADFNSNDNSHPVSLRQNNASSSSLSGRMGIIVENEIIGSSSNINHSSLNQVFELASSKRLEETERELKDKINAMEYWKEQALYHKDRFEKIYELLKDPRMP